MSKTVYQDPKDFRFYTLERVGGKTYRVYLTEDAAREYMESLRAAKRGGGDAC